MFCLLIFLSLFDLCRLLNQIMFLHISMSGLTSYLDTSREVLPKMIKLLAEFYRCFVSEGEEAILAKNVFYYLTYEGSVNLDAIEDPLTRKVNPL